jgi:ketosteroid isomerase-like protein
MNLVEFAVYHNIVRAKAAALFEAVNRGDAEPVLAAFAPSFEHIFIGQSALGGTRRTLQSTRAWYQRLYRLLPDITFDVRRISVSGAPWDTVVIAEWRETNSGTYGVETSAEGIHVLNIKWGRATRLIIAPDTARLEETLKRLAAAGHADAQAAQIVD